MGVWQTEKHLQGRRISPDDTDKAEVRKWLLKQDVSFSHQGFENLNIRRDKCLNKFGNYVGKRRTDV
jgi:hypothetical protein